MVIQDAGVDPFIQGTVWQPTPYIASASPTTDGSVVACSGRSGEPSTNPVNQGSPLSPMLRDTRVYMVFIYSLKGARLLLSCLPFATFVVCVYTRLRGTCYLHSRPSHSAITKVLVQQHHHHLWLWQF